MNQRNREKSQNKILNLEKEEGERHLFAHLTRIKRDYNRIAVSSKTNPKRKKNFHACAEPTRASHPRQSFIKAGERERWMRALSPATFTGACTESQGRLRYDLIDALRSSKRSPRPISGGGRQPVHPPRLIGRYRYRRRAHV